MAKLPARGATRAVWPCFPEASWWLFFSALSHCDNTAAILRTTGPFNFLSIYRHILVYFSMTSLVSQVRFMDAVRSKNPKHGNIQVGEHWYLSQDDTALTDFGLK